MKLNKEKQEHAQVQRSETVLVLQGGAFQIDSPTTREGSDGGLGCAINTRRFESFGCVDRSS